MLPTTTIPTSEVFLPILKKKYRVRAMNIKEEKILLTSKDAGDINDILYAIRELIKECTYGELDFNTLSIPDLSVLFIKIIELSKGTKSQHTYRCKNEIETENGKMICNNLINVDVDLNDIKITGETTNFDIELQDGIFAHMKYPSPEIYKSARDDSIQINKNGEEIVSGEEISLRVYAYCIESVIQGDHVYSEFTPEEAYHWLCSMNESVLENIIPFFENIPTVSLKYIVKCPKCGYEEEINISGLDGFFTQDILGKP